MRVKVFEGKNGMYYDPIGDEIFEATRITTVCKNKIWLPVYQMDFGDETKVGVVIANGLEVFLGETDG